MTGRPARTARQPTGGMHVVATAGHVDHGKSTLLKALTGMEPDRWEDEQRRGLTIDLGFVWTELPVPGEAPAGRGAGGPAGERSGEELGGAGGAPTLTVAFVDVPGHERFVRNMLAGAGTVRLALFVVAADDGWSAQSQEHLDILDLLGVSAAVVAVTKTDLAGGDRAIEVAADAEKRLAGTTLAGAPTVLVDGLSGRGVDELARVLARRLSATARPEDRGRPRLWIDRSFTVAGAGTVVTGTLTGGGLAGDDAVVLLPGGRDVRVRGLQCLGASVAAAPTGSRVAVNLAGVDRDEVGRGDALVGVTGASPGVVRARWRATSRLDAWVRALPGQEIGRTGAWHLHAGSGETTATLHPVLNEPVAPGSPGHVRVLLDRPLALVSGDRFVLRESGRQATLGGGVVLDPDPVERPRGTNARLGRAGDLDAIRDAPRGAARLAALVAAGGGARLADRAFAAADLAGTGGGAPAAGAPSAVEEPVEQPVEEVGLVAVGDHLVTSEAHARWSQAVVAAAREHHEREPSSRGPDRDTLAAAAVGAGAGAEVAGALVDALAGSGRLRRDGSAYALPEHAPRVDAAKQERLGRLLSALLAEPFAPPPLEEVAREAGVGHEEVNALVQSGRVVRCGRVAFARPAVDEAVRRLAGLGAGRFSTAEARKALDTSRKYAIPLLEHLDAVGVTEFDGQTRRLVRAPE